MPMKTCLNASSKNDVIAKKISVFFFKSSKKKKKKKKPVSKMTDVRCSLFDDNYFHKVTTLYTTDSDKLLKTNLHKIN